MSVEVMERMESKVKRMKEGKDDVRPGQPASFTEASSPGDFGWQGDLKIIVLATNGEKVSVTPTSPYAIVARPKKVDMQLVPGNTTGAKHCLDSLKGVKILRPMNWSEESTEGPILILKQTRTILHPTHGPVTIPAGFTVRLIYQREFDRELRKARRAID